MHGAERVKFETLLFPVPPWLAKILLYAKWRKQKIIAECDEYSLSGCGCWWWLLMMIATW